MRVRIRLMHRLGPGATRTALTPRIEERASGEDAVYTQVRINTEATPSGMTRLKTWSCR